MGTLAAGAEGCSADPQGHAGEPDHRFHGGDRAIFPPLLVPRPSSQTGPCGRTDRYRKIRLYHGVSTKEEQSRDLQAALRDILGADYR